MGRRPAPHPNSFGSRCPSGPPGFPIVRRPSDRPSPSPLARAGVTHRECPRSDSTTSPPRRRPIARSAASVCSPPAARPPSGRRPARRSGDGGEGAMPSPAGSSARTVASSTPPARPRASARRSPASGRSRRVLDPDRRPDRPLPDEGRAGPGLAPPHALPRLAPGRPARLDPADGEPRPSRPGSGPRPRRGRRPRPARPDPRAWRPLGGRRRQAAPPPPAPGPGAGGSSSASAAGHVRLGDPQLPGDLGVRPPRRVHQGPECPGLLDRLEVLAEAVLDELDRRASRPGSSAPRGPRTTGSRARPCMAARNRRSPAMMTYCPRSSSHRTRIGWSCPRALSDSGQLGRAALGSNSLRGWSGSGTIRSSSISAAFWAPRASRRGGPAWAAGPRADAPGITPAGAATAHRSRPTLARASRRSLIELAHGQAASAAGGHRAGARAVRSRISSASALIALAGTPLGLY